VTALKGDVEEDARTAILVVDDEDAVASVLARGLTYAGYEVMTANDGLDALERLSARHFDVLLTDIHMPRLRGDEMQRIARERDPELAVLMITAAEDVSGAVACLKDGVFDYLTKPFDLADVVVRVGKAVERQQLVRENNDYRRNLEQKVIVQAERLRTMMQASLEALIYALEAKDPTTRNHSNRVSELATLLAVALRPDDETFATQVNVAALFHDIGKIGVPEAVLNKPGPLTEDEMEQVRRHPVIGETILSPLLDADTIAMVRSHHEQWNGRGYPDGRMGEDIPFGGRIIAVADAYDAMSSARPYRREILRPVVLDILRRGADSQWDGRVVEALLQLAGEGRLGGGVSVPETVDRLPEAPPYVPISASKPPSDGGRGAS
jgi:response regulator RpfG family c-di-GMP phosphodiesterase